MGQTNCVDDMDLHTPLKRDANMGFASCMHIAGLRNSSLYNRNLKATENKGALVFYYLYT